MTRAGWTLAVFAALSLGVAGCGNGERPDIKVPGLPSSGDTGTGGTQAGGSGDDIPPPPPGTGDDVGPDTGGGSVPATDGDPSIPADATDPADPVDSADPADPADPANPSDPDTSQPIGTDTATPPATDADTGTDGDATPGDGNGLDTGSTPGTAPSTPPADSPDDTGTSGGGDAGTPPGEATSTPPADTTPVVDAPPPTFTYYPPGDLKPATGTGATENVVYAPGMVFPIKLDPAYLQSQVYNFGGGPVGGDQCDARNYAYPWRDNFCETRTSTYSTPYCPVSGVHLGQDIRVGTAQGCTALRSTSPTQRASYPVVAVEDGVISNVGRYTVNVRSGGRIYRYLHLNMARLEVALGDEVSAGDVIGYVSNDFGGAATTFHLHFEIKLNTAEHGWAYVPPYMSLVEAYERREGGPGLMVLPAAPQPGIASAGQ